MIEAAWEPTKFEEQWVKVNEEVVHRLLANADIQKIKERVRSVGHISNDDRNQFIELVNKVKYDCIYEKFGTEDTDTYKQFLKSWQHWQKLRVPRRPNPENMFESNINHLLYGSTPDPESFLKDFDVNRDI